MSAGSRPFVRPTGGGGGLTRPGIQHPEGVIGQHEVRQPTQRGAQEAGAHERAGEHVLEVPVHIDEQVGSSGAVQPDGAIRPERHDGEVGGRVTRPVEVHHAGQRALRPAGPRGDEPAPSGSRRRDRGQHGYRGGRHRERGVGQPRDLHDDVTVGADEAFWTGVGFAGARVEGTAGSERIEPAKALGRCHFV